MRNLFKKKVQYDFYGEYAFNSFIFEDDVRFRINHFNILGLKYNLDIFDIYWEWLCNERCSYIKLEQILKGRIVL